MTWRWRLDTSTVSKSTMPMVPTPAAARYSRPGAPRPPAPMNSTLEPSNLRLALGTHLGDQQVPAVALLLLPRQDDRRGPRAAARLPGLEAAAHGPDIGVAHRLERLPREQRAGAARAVRARWGSPGRARRPRSAARDSSCETWAAPPMWPSSHSLRSRTSMRRAPRSASSSASAGATSGTAARASRSRSDRELVMVGDSGWSAAAAAGELGEGRGRDAPVRPAAYTTRRLIPRLPGPPRSAPRGHAGGCPGRAART